MYNIITRKLDDYNFGWMTFFSKDLNIPVINIDGTSEKDISVGKILITTKEVFNKENINHIEKAKEVFNYSKNNAWKIPN